MPILAKNGIRIIQNLHWNQKSNIRIDQDQYTDEFEIQNVVCQGFILSPILFNLYFENIFAEALESTKTTVTVAWNK